VTDYTQERERVMEAISYAFGLHQGQTMKSGDPYSIHLAEVANTVERYGGGVTEIIAGLLHDSLEDRPHGGVTARTIEQRFGAAVLGIVQACTKPPKSEAQEGWEGRMRAYARQLVDGPPGTLLVAGSDKLVNARMTYHDLREKGLAVWDKFASGRDKLWYHQLMSTTISAHLPGQLARDLRWYVEAIMALDQQWRDGAL
jgi:GTP pyrophosphokinase